MPTLIEKLEQIRTEKQQISSAFQYASQTGILTSDISAIAFSDYSNTVSSIVSVAVDAADKYEQLSTDYDELSTNYNILSGEYEQLSINYDELSTENANALSIADQILS